MIKNLRYLCTLLLCMVASVGWGDTYKKITSSSAFSTGQYLIVYEGESLALSGSGTTAADIKKGTKVKITNGQIDATTATNAIAVLITASDENKYLIQTVSGYYIYNTSSTNNGFSVSQNLNTAENYPITINFDDSGNANIISSGNYLRYNPSASSPIFNFYKAASYSSQKAINLYKLESGETPSLEDNDLSLTGAPIALTFDLYNNSNAQTISYTTSSTGAVTVSASDYVTTEVNETDKTITVIPKTSVTPSVQTITVSQAADDTYAAGSATFTVSISDSTPFEGGDVTFDATQDKGNTSAGEGSITKNGVTLTCDNGILGNGTEYRLYKNSNTTISTTSGVITKIVFTCKSTNPASGFSELAGFDAETGTWTGSATSVTFIAENKQVQATEIVVTIDMNATPDPIINASDVNIAYDATSGSIEYSISNPVAGTSLTAVVTEGDWLTLVEVGEASVSFTCSANEATEPRTATVTLTYDELTKEVIVTQAAAPLIYTTIPALFAAATSTETDVTITFGNWVVSGVSTNGKNIFVTDNNGNGFVIYYGSDMSSTFSAGNILSGTVACKLKKYNGFAELVNLDANDLSITSGGSVTTSSIAMADLAGVNTGALVSYENLTCSVDNNKYYLTDGTTTIQVYNALYAFDALEAGKTYNITGVYQQYNNTKEVMPRSEDDIVEMQEASVVVNPTSVNVTAAGEEGTLDVTYNYISDPTSATIILCDVNGETATYNWIVADFDNDKNIEYLIDANTGEARTAYLKVKVGDVYSNLVTITQAAQPTGDDYELFSGNLVEGDYIICYDGKAMNTTVTNDRLQYAEVSPANNVITTDNAAIVWHIAPSGEYWTIFNAAANAYAAGTGVKNKAQMLADGTDDKALWTVSGTETYEFVNKANAAASVNANLRKNGDYGFACYASTTGGALSLYKKVGDTPQPEKVKVSVNAAATDGKKFYSTLYYGEKNLKIPEGITASGVSMNGKALVMGPELDKDDVIAKGNAVLLKAEAYGDYEFTVVADTEVDATISWDANQLRGNDTDAQTTGGDVYYQLSRNANKDPNSIGFYWGATDGGAFTNKGHRAYLAVSDEEAKGISGFAFGDDTDGIGQIENGNMTMENAEIYNLAGQRVNKAQKGIYIVNGKKIVIK